MKRLRPRRNSTTPVILIAGILIAVIAAVIFFGMQGEKQTPVSNNPNNVLVIVNNESITQKEIDDLYSRLPSQYKMKQSLDGSVVGLNQSEMVDLKNYLIGQEIDSRLLAQEAMRQGKWIDDKSVDEQFTAMLARNNMTDASFKVFVASQNLTYDEFKKELKNQLVIVKLINDTIVSKTAVTDVEIDEFYGTQGLEGIENATLTNETKTEIRSYLMNQKILAAVQLLLKQLRDQASIVEVNAVQ